ncbi:hypothetical protein ACVWWN_003912 [Mycobacterium sp. URHB0021]
MPLTSIGIDTFVVDTPRANRHRARGSEHLSLMVITVADHQPMTVLIHLAGVGIDVDGHLSL